MAGKRITVTPQADLDVDEAALYLAQEADIDTAVRFFNHVYRTYDEILSMPGMDAPRELVPTILSGLRQWPVSGFPNHLIFYLTTTDQVLVVRVLHGARDIDSILSEETS